MNKVALSGMARKDMGTKFAAQLRRDKRVPCVLYGGKENFHFSVEEAALGKLIFTPDLNGIELDVDGKKTLALVKEKQFHPITDRVIHVDFVEVDEKKVTNAVLSLRLNGQPVGVRSGGVMSQTMRKVRVKALPSDLPKHLELDIAKLALNETIHVSDLKFKGLTILERPDDVVVAIKMPKKKEEVVAPGAVPAAGAAVPAAAAKTAAAAPAGKAEEAKPAAKK